jgi:LysR family nitrogen assimilation transcriptional regulator
LISNREFGMTPRQLRYFVEIARAGSLSQASINLRVAQPALSQHVAVLEAELGVVLLERHAKGVVLTAEGKRLNQRAGAILAQLETLKADVLAQGDQPRGPVRLCLSRSLAPAIVGPLFKRLERQAPEVRLQLSSAMSSEVRTALLRHQIDLALMPNAFEMSGMLRCRPLYQEGLSLFGVEPAAARRARTIEFGAIGSRPLVSPDRDHDLRRLIERASLDLGCPLNVKYEVNDPSVCLAMVRAGLAYAVLPDSVAAELVLPGSLVAQRHIVKPAITRIQSLVRAPDEHVSNASAVDAVEKALSEVIEAETAAGCLSGMLIPPSESSI